jgi:excisionase family DNA binding protein
MNNARDPNTHANAPYTNPSDFVLLTVDEVAQILRVPRSWVYSHLDLLPTVRLGRYIRFRRSDIEDFVAEQGRGTGTCQ